MKCHQFQKAFAMHLITLGWILHVGRWGRYKNSYFVVMSLHVHICPYIICGQWFEHIAATEVPMVGATPALRHERTCELQSTRLKASIMEQCCQALEKVLVHVSMYMCGRSSLAFDFGQKPSFYLWWNKQLRITNKTIILWVRNSTWLSRRSSNSLDWVTQVLRQSQQPLV